MRKPESDFKTMSVNENAAGEVFLQVDGGHFVAKMEFYLRNQKDALEITKRVNEHAALNQIAECSRKFLKFGDINKHGTLCTCAACKLWEALSALANLRKQ